MVAAAGRIAVCALAARSHVLRGAYAVHLASALAIGDRDLVVAVWDRSLDTGVKAVDVRAVSSRRLVPLTWTQFLTRRGMRPRACTVELAGNG